MHLPSSGMCLTSLIELLIVAASEVGVVLLQAVGETWDKTPELKFLALKRMYKYMVCSQPHLISLLGPPWKADRSKENETMHIYVCLYGE